ncbi:50S ribosomal protein L21 [Anaerobaca lacustris]|uniref:Large ribosomal subunit protein bL21 n=1 Tax=Anaerobaca lacustris TaxID=3044600 RepID=A0AAW6U5D9_9BACT|nr:50S ribosomal protein L21 [Sedimentisphaerales bacterium M17dextr]
MYAVIEQGGKQHKVAEGDRLNIELVDIDPQATQIEMDKVLFVGDGANSRLGTPYVDGAKVLASFNGSAEEAVVKGEKLYITYFRRRKNSKCRIGHRQKYLQVTIDKIEA